MYKSVFVVQCDGLLLHVRDWNGSGTACILIHGLAEGGFVWDNFASQISPYCRVITIDLRGHGGSNWDPQKRYCLDTHVADVTHVLDHLGLQSYVLIGHSLGGCVAAKIAALRPRELVAAVLVDTGPSADASKDALVYEQIVEGYRKYRTTDEYFDWLSSKRFLANRRSLKQFAENALISRRPYEYTLKFDLAVAKSVLQSSDQTWWWPALAKSHAPILIVRGMGSAILSNQLAIQMANAAPKGELAVVELAGHSVLGDNPEGFSEAVIPFLLAQFQPRIVPP